MTNKIELMERVHEDFAHLTRHEITLAIEVIFQAYLDHLIAKGEVVIWQLCRIRIEDLPEREGMNPRLGRRATLPPVRRLQYRELRDFARRLNAETGATVWYMPPFKTVF